MTAEGKNAQDEPKQGRYLYSNSSVAMLLVPLPYQLKGAYVARLFTNHSRQ
jgi:hypothetical protein